MFEPAVVSCCENNASAAHTQVEVRVVFTLCMGVSTCPFMCMDEIYWVYYCFWDVYIWQCIWNCMRSPTWVCVSVCGSVYVADYRLSPISEHTAPVGSLTHAGLFDSLVCGNRPPLSLLSGVVTLWPKTHTKIYLFFSLWLTIEDCILGQSLVTKNCTVMSSISPSASSCSGSWWGSGPHLSQLSAGERRGTPSTNHRFITGFHWSKERKTIQ